MRNNLFLFNFWAFLCGFSALVAQPRQAQIQVIVSPTTDNWQVQMGKRADFQVQVLENGLPVETPNIHYQIGLEQMPPELEGDLTLTSSPTILKGIQLSEPGFVRCEVSTEIRGRTYRAWGTAGFAPEQLQPTVAHPADFDTFWNQAKAELAEIPLDPQLTLLPDRCTPKMDVYHLRLTNWGEPNWRGNTSYLYGILAVPKGEGPFPAILNVPGAGARPYGPDARAEEGVITLTIGIHGLPVNLDQGVYDNLMQGAIFSYWTKGLEDRDHYYYKRVYLGCVRAVDYLTQMDEFDGKQLAVSGGSQGGALSIVTAGLDERITHLAAFYPALCDMTGYLHGRAGGWPHMFKSYEEEISPAWKEVAPYFDVVNFARRVAAQGWYSWGFNDNVCPPTSMYAAYNVISAPKELHLALQTAHWTFPEQREDATDWLLKQLKE